LDAPQVEHLPFEGLDCGSKVGEEFDEEFLLTPPSEAFGIPAVPMYIA
jgi:hypothetical protein